MRPLAPGRAQQPPAGYGFRHAEPQAGHREERFRGRHRHPVQVRREAAHGGDPAVVVDDHPRRGRRASSRHGDGAQRVEPLLGARRQRLASASFTAVPTSATVVGCTVSAGPLTSTTPSSSPLRGSCTGQAVQVQPWWLRTKCSAEKICTGASSASAVPIALVPDRPLGPAAPSGEARARRPGAAPGSIPRATAATPSRRGHDHDVSGVLGHRGERGPQLRAAPSRSGLRPPPLDDLGRGRVVEGTSVGCDAVGEHAVPGAADDPAQRGLRVGAGQPSVVGLVEQAAVAQVRTPGHRADPVVHHAHLRTGSAAPVSRSITAQVPLSAELGSASGRPAPAAGRCSAPSGLARSARQPCTSTRHGARHRVGSHGRSGSLVRPLARCPAPSGLPRSARQPCTPTRHRVDLHGRSGSLARPLGTRAGLADTPTPVWGTPAGDRTARPLRRPRPVLGLGPRPGRTARAGRRLHRLRAARRARPAPSSGRARRPRG